MSHVIRFAESILHGDEGHRKWLMETAIAYSAKIALGASFVSVEVATPGHSIPVVGYNPEWVDLDFNHDGVRECFEGDDYWTSAKWNGCQDCWDADVDTSPTHWKYMVNDEGISSE